MTTNHTDEESAPNPSSQAAARNLEDLRSVDEQHLADQAYEHFLLDPDPPPPPPSPAPATQAPAAPSPGNAEQAFPKTRGTAPTPAPKIPSPPPQDTVAPTVSSRRFKPASNSTPPAPSGQQVPAALSSNEARPKLSSATKSTEKQDAKLADSSKRAQKIAIIGAKEAGKTYLFHAMVYRTFAAKGAGSMGYFLDQGGSHLRSSHWSSPGQEQDEDPWAFLDAYTGWNRLGFTKLTEQRWYYLRLPYHSGWRARDRRHLEIRFFDASGDFLGSQINLETIGEELRNALLEAYAEVTTVVFCLPLWVVFPKTGLPPEDWDGIDNRLREFSRMVMNYRQLLKVNKNKHSIRSILALTMADDPRCRLESLQERWIEPYVKRHKYYAANLLKGRNLARYLENARKISEYLHGQFDSVHHPLIGGIPNSLNFTGNRPWLIPVSAIKGETLAELCKLSEQDRKTRIHESHASSAELLPIPVHVELPLLVALCEQENALM